MKKLINDIDNIILEELKGMHKAHNDIINICYDPIVITRINKKDNKTALVSGGGSGHEPLHGGFVGYGMLDAACPGAVFTSPTPDQIEEAAKSVNSGNGVIFLVKNYTGDVINSSDLYEKVASALKLHEGYATEETAKKAIKSSILSSLKKMHHFRLENGLIASWKMRP